MKKLIGTLSEAIPYKEVPLSCDVCSVCGKEVPVTLVCEDANVFLKTEECCGKEIEVNLHPIPRHNLNALFGVKNP